MLSDNPSYMPILYVIFVLLTSELRSTTILEWQTILSREPKWYRFLAGWVQTFGLLLFPCTNGDDYPYIHFAAGITVAVATIVREIEFNGFKSLFIQAAHFFGILVIIGTITAYLIVTQITPDAEKYTNIALLEFTFFFFVAAMSVFNVVKI